MSSGNAAIITPGEIFLRGNHIGGGIYVTKRNHLGQIEDARGTVVPTSAKAGYAVGCTFTLYNASLGQAVKWANLGTATSCLFVPADGAAASATAWGVVAGGHGPYSAGSDATEYISDKDVNAGDRVFTEHGVCDDNDQHCGIVAADGRIVITATADPTAGAKQYNYVALRQGVISEYEIFAAGTYDCLTADDTTVAITVTGVKAGDIAMATYSVSDDTDLISDIVCTTDTVTITISADAGTDGTHSWDYVVFRKKGTFKPSHYIAYAGEHTTLGGDTVEAITITGALATDIAICKWGTTNDTDTIAKAILTADTLTVTLSADPSTAHTLQYMILRAYD